jgi:hydroxymethylpyrimidine/phosphomethylpyrimidine kinase
MKNALLVLEEFQKVHQENQYLGVFVEEVLMATSGGVVLNGTQESFLRQLLSALTPYQTRNIFEAMRIATWINSCR